MTRINTDYIIKQNNQGGRTDNKDVYDNSDRTNIYERLKQLRCSLDPKKILLADDDFLGNTGGGFPIIISGGA